MNRPLAGLVDAVIPASSAGFIVDPVTRVRYQFNRASCPALFDTLQVGMRVVFMVGGGARATARRVALDARAAPPNAPPLATQTPGQGASRGDA